ncbi:hypothetical protein [Nocardia sp. NPDC050710]|uniref:hypothetical protein n=1 Tax=Nocardia sp. NPDC050710 TaxID=3157220 RepID=UPI0033F6E8A2
MSDSALSEDRLDPRERGGWTLRKGRLSLHVPLPATADAAAAAATLFARQHTARWPLIEWSSLVTDVTVSLVASVVRQVQARDYRGPRPEAIQARLRWTSATIVAIEARDLGGTGSARHNSDPALGDAPWVGYRIYSVTRLRVRGVPTFRGHTPASKAGDLWRSTWSPWAQV